MAFQTTLPTGEHLLIENRDGQTLLTFASGSSSQRQSQRSGFSSGAWTHPPTLWQSQGGLILRVEAEKSHYLHLEGHGMRHLEAAPDLRDAELLPLQRAEASKVDSHPLPPMKPLEPMKPMASMKPMAPMEMRLGSMHMSMGGPSETAPPTLPAPPSKNDSTRAAFCTQCGQPAEETDRFCARCGHELRAL